MASFNKLPSLTVGMDLGYIRTVLVHATAIHGIETPTDGVIMARTAWRRLALSAKAMSVSPDSFIAVKRHIAAAESERRDAHAASTQEPPS